MRVLLISFLGFILVGCSETAMTPFVRMMMDEEMEARVDTITNDIVRRDRDALRPKMSSVFSESDLDAGFAELFANLPAGQPESIAPVSYQFRSNMSLNDGRSGSQRTVEVRMRLDYGDAVGYVDIVLFAEQGEDYSIMRLRTQTNGEITPAVGRDI
jgi:hypothetical protein